MNTPTFDHQERRRNVRLAVIIALVALALYGAFWLKAVL